MKMITATVLKPHMAPNGVIVQRGAEIEVDEQRYRQLLKRGYVGNHDGEAENVSSIEAPKEGITNADFQPRRETIVGDRSPAKPKPAERAAKPAGKRKAAKPKPAETASENQQPTEGNG
jgi:hypothetical protein